jgi:hypothetical protein
MTFCYNSNLFVSEPGVSEHIKVNPGLFICAGLLIHSNILPKPFHVGAETGVQLMLKRCLSSNLLRRKVSTPPKISVCSIKRKKRVSVNLTIKRLLTSYWLGE